MSLMTQAKVLRALEMSQVRPVGSDATVSVNLRVIAATNHDLETRVEAGHFREDLFFRLNVLPIRLPPLQERGNDVEALARYFVRRAALEDGVSPPTLSASAVLELSRHDWPGNVRELQNLMARLVVLFGPGEIGRKELIEARDGVQADLAPTPVDLREARAAFERDFIRKALAAHGGRITATAKTLGINRSHLWKKMRALEIDSPDAG